MTANQQQPPPFSAFELDDSFDAEEWANIDLAEPRRRERLWQRWELPAVLGHVGFLPARRCSAHCLGPLSHSLPNDTNCRLSAPRLPAWLSLQRGKQGHAFQRLAEDEGAAGAATAAEEGLQGGRGAAAATGPVGTQPPSRPAGAWCPEEHAGLASRVFFSWVGSLLALGHGKTLEQGDLWDTMPGDEAAAVSDAFRWHLRQTPSETHPQVRAPAARAGFSPYTASQRHLSSQGCSGTIRLDRRACGNPKLNHEPRFHVCTAQGVLWRAMWRTHGRAFAVAGAWKLLHE